MVQTVFFLLQSKRTLSLRVMYVGITVWVSSSTILSNFGFVLREILSIIATVGVIIHLIKLNDSTNKDNDTPLILLYLIVEFNSVQLLWWIYYTFKSMMWQRKLEKRSQLWQSEKDKKERKDVEE